MIHTGDLTHLAKAGEFATLEDILGGQAKQVFYVPGEHDFTGDSGKLYLDRFGKGTKGSGWYSFDHKGVHFVGLNNVAQLEGLGLIGREQLDWMNAIWRRWRPARRCCLAHIPLWSVYPEWGWGTKDGEEALDLLKRFGSVTVLNGHIHQVMQKVEGHVAFHTARSTAFPQPAPGSALAGPQARAGGRAAQMARRSGRSSIRPPRRCSLVTDTDLPPWRLVSLRDPFFAPPAGGAARREPGRSEEATPIAARRSMKPARTATRLTRMMSGRVIAAYWAQGRLAPGSRLFRCA